MIGIDGIGHVDAAWDQTELGKNVRVGLLLGKKARIRRFYAPWARGERGQPFVSRISIQPSEQRCSLPRILRSGTVGLNQGVEQRSDGVGPVAQHFTQTPIDGTV
jgi:hypothetical protein